MPRFLLRLLGHNPDREWQIAVLRNEQHKALMARREARRETNARARRGVSTKIHKQFERDPLILAARG